MLRRKKLYEQEKSIVIVSFIYKGTLKHSLNLLASLFFKKLFQSFYFNNFYTTIVYHYLKIYIFKILLSTLFHINDFLPRQKY